MDLGRVMTAEVKIELLFLGPIEVLLAEFAGDEGVYAGRKQSGDGAAAASAAKRDTAECRGSTCVIQHDRGAGKAGGDRDEMRGKIGR